MTLLLLWRRKSNESSAEIIAFVIWLAHLIHPQQRHSMVSHHSTRFRFEWPRNDGNYICIECRIEHRNTRIRKVLAVKRCLSLVSFSLASMMLGAIRLQTWNGKFGRFMWIDMNMALHQLQLAYLWIFFFLLRFSHRRDSDRCFWRCDVCSGRRPQQAF